MNEDSLPRKIVVRLEGPLPPELSPNCRANWPTRYRAAQRVKQDVVLLARSIWPGPPAERVRVIPTVYFAQQRRRDRDNITAMLKPALDGLIGVCVIDDDYEYLVLEPVVILRGAPGLTLWVHELGPAGE